jgi:hypothetical protein
MAFSLARIEASVARDKTVNESAVTLLGQLSQMIRDTAGDEAKANELADQLDAQQQALADAIVANTPAAPTA